MTDWILDDPASKVFPLCSRANVGEVFPDPITPLNATAGFLRNLELGWRDSYVEAGLWDHDFYDDSVPHNPLVCFSGYLYINMSLARLYGVRLGFGAEMVDAQYFGDMPGIPSYESEARPGDVDPEATTRATRWLADDVLGARDLARYDAERAEVEAVVRARPALAKAPDEVLLDRVVGFDPLFRKLWCSHIVASGCAGLGLGGVAQVAAAVGRPELALVLSSGVGDVDSAGASRDMWPLSRTVRASASLGRVFDAGVEGLFRRLRDDGSPEATAFLEAFGAFLERWGFRGPNEWELRNPTWGTEPDVALGAIGAMAKAGDDESPEVTGRRAAKEREEATAAVAAALAGDEEAAGRFDGYLRVAHLFSRARERARMTAALLCHEQRLAADELGRRAAAAGRLARPEHVYMLTRDELVDHVGSGGTTDRTALAEEREHRYLELFDYVPPFVVVGDPPPLSRWERRSRAGEAAELAVGATLAGLGGAPGAATGPARVLTDPGDPTALEPGEVLVAPITDPAWTPLFLAAAGVVCDVGAPVSHAAIVSRELGIPCVVSAQGACAAIRDGMVLELDGTAGTVRRLS